MEIYDFSVAPGAVAEIHCEGTYAYFSSGSAGGADATISLKHDAAGSRVLLLPGQGFRMGEGQVGRRWLVSNYAGTATIAGRLVIGNGAIDDNRVTGSVEVIDGGKARTMAGAAFMGNKTIGGVAAKMPASQIYNPAASGKRVIVSKVTAQVSAADGFAFYLRNGPQLVTTSTQVPSKLAGGAASAALLQTENLSTFPTQLPLVGFNLPASGSVTFKFDEPVVVMPGYALIGLASTADNAGGCSFEFFEETI